MLYPVLTDSRTVSDLSGVWSFALGGDTLDGARCRARLSTPMTMAVPASYNDLKDSVALRDHYGWVYYQRQIAVPRFMREGRRVVLRFDAVTQRACVYLNDLLICDHVGGFLPFEVEISDKLRDGNNLLTVAVCNIIDYTTLPIGGENAMLSNGTVAGRNYRPRKNRTIRISISSTTAA